MQYRRRIPHVMPRARRLRYRWWYSAGVPARSLRKKPARSMLRVDLQELDRPGLRPPGAAGVLAQDAPSPVRPAFHFDLRALPLHSVQRRRSQLQCQRGQRPAAHVRKDADGARPRNANDILWTVSFGRGGRRFEDLSGVLKKAVHAPLFDRRCEISGEFSQLHAGATPRPAAHRQARRARQVFEKFQAAAHGRLFSAG